ncbi:MAG: 50S ribosomal protein L17 [Clostridiaceae bacterium]|nr:50S ribosomal protein L17 [Clostridiaceae bacterium]
MSAPRKLGRKSAARRAMLRGLVTDLILYGSIETTLQRAQETRKIAERLITSAIKERDNYTTKEVLVSGARLDGKSRKVLAQKTSLSGNEMDVVVRELKTEMRQVDNPSRLAARRRAMNWLIRRTDDNGRRINPVNHLFNDVAPRFVDRNGGYTSIVRLGPRRGDGAMMVRLSLVE